MTSQMKTKSKQIKLSKIIQPHFKAMWNTKCPYIIAKGGRGSFKSSTISLKLCVMMKKQTQLNHRASIVCIRENSTYLRDSVYSQITWALNMLNMQDEFIFGTTPMRIIHRRTGSCFYFYGSQDPMKLKSNIIGDVIALWYEEASNFDSAEVFDQTNPTFIRQKSPFVDYVPVYYSYNPPRNTYDWINEWTDSKASDDNFFVDKSTYLDDELGVTSEQQLELIETYRKNDYDYYRYLYLGEAVGLGTNVYNMNLFHKLEKLPSDDPIMYLAYSIDAGHAQSATTCGCYGFTAKGNVIVLDTYYYDPSHQSIKKAPSDLSKEIHDFMKRTQRKYPVEVVKRTIDSAEAALRNQYYKDFQIQWHPIAKKKEATMIDYVQDLLAQGRVFYLDIPANQIFIEEHRQYQWDEKYIQTDDPKVIKQHDHTVDQFKYMAMDNARQLFLKI